MMEERKAIIMMKLLGNVKVLYTQNLALAQKKNLKGGILLWRL